jgi:acyl carrier protein
VQSANNDLGSRLIDLVQELLGPGAMVPQPFPMDQQLSELGVSSLKMVNLMLSVESAFDIMIPAAEITPENFHSVAAIRALVERTLRARPSP